LRGGKTRFCLSLSVRGRGEKKANRPAFLFSHIPIQKKREGRRGNLEKGKEKKKGKSFYNLILPLSDRHESQGKAKGSIHRL